jgi:hypothetical protein
MYFSKVKRSMFMVFQEVGLRLAVRSPVSPQDCQTVTERHLGRSSVFNQGGFPCGV